MSQHGGNIWGLAKQHQLDPSEIIDFSANINPLGPSTHAVNAIITGIKDISHYPEPTGAQLISAISQHYQVEKERIVVGNGAMELLFAVVNLIRPERCVAPVPTFSGYQEALKGKHKIKKIPTYGKNNFNLVKDEILSVVPKCDILFLCNPNNPTGQLTDRFTLTEIVENAKRDGTMVMVDESFIDFVPEWEKYSMKPLLNRYENLIILQSLTKFFAIPGLRLGSIMGSPALIKSLKKQIPPWNVNILAERAGIAALKDNNYIRESRLYIELEKEYLYQELSKVPGFYVVPPAANFILVDGRNTGQTARQWQNKLIKYKILIRDCKNFSGLDEYFFRVAVKSRKENNMLIEALNNTF